MTRLLAILVLLCADVIAEAQIYVSQSGAGSQNGTSAGDAYPVSWLNTSGNWGSSAGQVGPGVTVYLEGTITSYIVLAGSGNAGNPITILFDVGAGMTSPVWTGTQGAAIYGAVHDVVINGGVNGYINATACGWNLANTVGCNGIVIDGGVRMTVENLTISNLFVQVAESGIETATSQAIVFLSDSVSVSNVVRNCSIHDTRTAVTELYGGACKNFTVTGCTISNINWGIAIGDNNSGASINGILCSNNTVHGFSNWDDQNYADAYHHDGIFVYGSAGWASNVTVCANTVGPGYGSGNSAVFLEGNIYASFVFNNIFLATDGGGPASGMLDLSIVSALGATNFTCNNDFIGSAQNANGIIVINNSGQTQPPTYYAVTNNLFYNVNLAITLHYFQYSLFASDYNLFYDLPSTFLVVSTDNTYNGWSLTQWQSDAEGGQFLNELHCSVGNPLLNSSYVPQPGSAAIGAGANLAPTLPTLLTDLTGNARPPAGQGTWDIGAVSTWVNPSLPNAGAKFTTP